MGSHIELQGKWDKLQAAKFFGISVKTLNDWIYKGLGLRHVKYCNKLFFDPKDCEAFKRSLIEVRSR